MLLALKTFYQRKRARQVFQRWAASYEQDVENHQYSAAQAVQQAVMPYLRPGQAITDLGIGTGLIWRGIVRPPGCILTGLDIAPDMLAQASAIPDIGPLYDCDIGTQYWPISDHSQDIIVSAGLFEYLTEPMIKHVFHQAARILKPGGVFVTTYIPAEHNQTRLWNGRSGRILSCRFQPDWMESQEGFQCLTHSDPFKGSIYADQSSYAYRLIIFRKAD